MAATLATLRSETTMRRVSGIVRSNAAPMSFAQPVTPEGRAFAGMIACEDGAFLSLSRLSRYCCGLGPVSASATGASACSPGEGSCLSSLR